MSWIHSRSRKARASDAKLKLHSPATSGLPSGCPVETRPKASQRRAGHEQPKLPRTENGSFAAVPQVRPVLLLATAVGIKASKGRDWAECPFKTDVSSGAP